MKAYIYDVETMVVIASIEGDSNAAIESKLVELGLACDEYAMTYSPAFGSASGLIEACDFEEYTV